MVVEHVRQTALRDLAQRLASWFSAEPPRDYVPGKTALRDAVMEIEACSAAEAERRVDELEAAGLIVFEGETSRIGRGASWRLG